MAGLIIMFCTHERFNPQAVFAMILFNVCLLLQLLYQPFADPTHNRLEVGSLLCSLATIVLSLPLLPMTNQVAQNFPVQYSCKCIYKQTICHVWLLYIQSSGVSTEQSTMAVLLIFVNLVFVGLSSISLLQSAQPKVKAIYNTVVEAVGTRKVTLWCREVRVHHHHPSHQLRLSSFFRHWSTLSKRPRIAETQNIQHKQSL